MARTDRPRQKEEFFKDVDRARISGDWSCGAVIGILVVLYVIGVALLLALIP